MTEVRFERNYPLFDALSSILKLDAGVTHSPQSTVHRVAEDVSAVAVDSGEWRC